MLFVQDIPRDIVIGERKAAEKKEREKARAAIEGSRGLRCDYSRGEFCRTGCC
jgi:hypothetical protein